MLCDGGRTGHVSDHVFVLQLCLGGLGLQAWRLQQETLWFGRAGESHPQCTDVFVAAFVSQCDRLLILFPLILLVESSLHDLPSLTPSLPPSLLLLPPLFCWHGWTTEGGLMSHDVLGVVQRCALPAWITMGAPLAVMQDSAACSASKVHLFCFDAAGVKQQRSVCVCVCLCG